MNQLVQRMEAKRGNDSIRKFSGKLGISHSHLAKVLRGEQVVTWDFAAAVASGMGLDHIEAFKMAGLIPNEEGDTPGGASPTSEKVTSASIAGVS